METGDVNDVAHKLDKLKASVAFFSPSILGQNEFIRIKALNCYLSYSNRDKKLTTLFYYHYWSSTISAVLA